MSHLGSPRLSLIELHHTLSLSTLAQHTTSYLSQILPDFTRPRLGKIHHTPIHSAVPYMGRDVSDTSRQHYSNPHSIAPCLEHTVPCHIPDKHIIHGRSLLCPITCCLALLEAYWSMPHINVLQRVLPNTTEYYHVSPNLGLTILHLVLACRDISFASM